MPASGRSRRAWGWHPLVDAWAGRIVADAAVQPGDLVFDIGAGHGALTLLRLLLAPRSTLARADLVLQRAVVRRYVEGRSALGGRWDARIGQLLPRRAFRPPPPVDSAVLVVRSRLSGQHRG